MSWSSKMGALGWMGIPFPEEVGGAGGTSLQYAIAVEELTRIDSSVAITMCAHTSLGTQPIYLFGSDEQKARLLPDLCAGRKLGAFGLTEPEAGSDAGNVKTRAALDGGEWVVDGAKQFITNAGTEISGHVAITGEDRRERDLQPHRRERHRRLRAGQAVPQDGVERVGHAAAGASRAAACPRTTCSARAATASSSSCTSWTSAASASRRWASAWRRARWTRR